MNAIVSLTIITKFNILITTVPNSLITFIIRKLPTCKQMDIFYTFSYIQYTRQKKTKEKKTINQNKM